MRIRLQRLEESSSKGVYGRYTGGEVGAEGFTNFSKNILQPREP